jgi:hypothetical protein
MNTRIRRFSEFKPSSLEIEYSGTLKEPNFDHHCSASGKRFTLIKQGKAVVPEIWACPECKETFRVSVLGSKVSEK